MLRNQKNLPVVAEQRGNSFPRLGLRTFLALCHDHEGSQKKEHLKNKNAKPRTKMMYARALDFAHQTHPPLSRISQSRAGGPETLAFAAASAGLVTAGLFLAIKTNDSIKRHSLQPHSFAYPVVSRRLSTSRFTTLANPVNMLTANNVEPTPMLTLKAEAGESRGIGLLCLRLGHHRCLETFKHHN